ncbi:MAG: glycosyltransferase [Candidatus Hodarchaeota archaeon]
MASIVFILVISIILLCPVILYGFLVLLGVISAKIRTLQIPILPDSIPTVSVIIPTYNESKVIERRIRNLFETDYPLSSFEVIAVDDSSDETSEILIGLKKNYPHLKVEISKERRGYSKAVETGIAKASGEIIVLAEGGSLHYKDTIRCLVRGLLLKQVGGVTGKPIIHGKGYLSKSEKTYRKFYNLLRIGETKLSSTFHFNGEACAFWKKLVFDLKDLDGDWGMAAAILVRRKGYRTIYLPQARFKDFAPSSISDRNIQKKVRSAGIFRTLKYAKPTLFNPRFGIYGFAIIPGNIWLLIGLPLSIPILLLNVGLLTFLTLPFQTSLIVIFLLILLITIGDRVSSGFFLSIFQLSLNLLQGFWLYIRRRRRTHLIPRVDSTRG